jgi:major membrane immunogen (membrane-anchored lipoprotein)
MRKLFLIVLLAVFVAATAKAGDITGKWKTIDDATEKAKSTVEISKKDGKLFGHVVGFYNEDPNYDPICDECKDHLKDKKIKGMQIINGLTQVDGKLGWR